MSWSWLVRLQFMFRGTVIYDRGMKAVGAQEFQVLLVMTHRLMCIAHCWCYWISNPIWSQIFLTASSQTRSKELLCHFQPSSLRGTGVSGFASHDASLDVHCRLLVLLNFFSDLVTIIFLWWLVIWVRLFWDYELKH
jgi:hypothetical protein